MTTQNLTPLPEPATHDLRAEWIVAMKRINDEMARTIAMIRDLRLEVEAANEREHCCEACFEPCDPSRRYCAHCDRDAIDEEFTAYDQHRLDQERGK